LTCAADFYGNHNDTINRDVATTIQQDISQDGHNHLIYDDELSEQDFFWLLEQSGMFDPSLGSENYLDDYDPYFDAFLGSDGMDPEFEELEDILSFVLPPTDDHLLPFLPPSLDQEVSEDDEVIGYNGHNDEIEFEEDAIIQNPYNIEVPNFHPMYDYIKSVKNGLSRKRREALIDTMTVHNPQEWWNDIDSGFENAVTKKLTRTKAGISSQYKMLDSLDHYSPALHLGEINTGYLRRPELEQASDRTFGQDADFYIGDMHAFKFTPQGERYGGFHQLLSDIKSGQMVVGRRFILNKKFFCDADICYINKQLHQVQDVSKLDPQGFVDPGTEAALQVYWSQVSCQGIKPGTYIFLFIKHYSNSGNQLIGFQDMYGRQISAMNPNFHGMQAASPYSTATGVRSLYKYGASAALGPVTTYAVNQVDISHTSNSQYTGARMGMKSIDNKYYQTNSLQAPYDESSVWLEGTHRVLPKSLQKNLLIKQKHINNLLFDSPYEATFDYGCKSNDDCKNGECVHGNCVDCKPGFEKRDGACTDIDECLTSCGDHGTCVNTVGSYTCDCDQGYKFEQQGQTCVDINECQESEEFGGLCGYGSRCFNREGEPYSCTASFRCGQIGTAWKDCNPDLSVQKQSATECQIACKIDDHDGNFACTYWQFDGSICDLRESYCKEYTVDENKVSGFWNVDPVCSSVF